MKSFAATLIAAVAFIALQSPAARAESTYWDSRGGKEAPSAQRYEPSRKVVRERAPGDRRVIIRRERKDRTAAVPRPIQVERNDGRAWPTMNNDYWLQQSIYDFQDGKAADLKRYRY